MTAAVIVFVVLSAGVIGTTLQWRRAEANEQLAAARAEEAASSAEMARQAADREREARALADTKANEASRAAYRGYIALADVALRENNGGAMQKWLRACPENLRMWEWGYLARQSDFSVRTFREAGVGVHCVAFSNDGKKVVSGAESNSARPLKIWDVETGDEILEIKVPVPPRSHGTNNEGEPVTSFEWMGFASVAFNPDGSRVLSVGREDVIHVWNAQNGRELLTLGRDLGDPLIEHASGRQHLIPWLGVHAGFRPDGTGIVRWFTETAVQPEVLDARTGEVLLDMEDDLGPCVRHSPDGATIFAFTECDDGGKEALIDLIVRCVSYSPDGTRIVAGRRKTVILWDATSGDEIMVLWGHEDHIQSVAYSPDGRQIISASRSEIRVWDAATGENESAMLVGHDIFSVGHDPQGLRIVYTSRDGTALVVRDAETDEELWTMRGHGGKVNAVAYSPDRTRMITASTDKTLKLWNAETDAGATLGHVARPPGRRGPGPVSISPDRSRIAYHIQDGSLILLNVNNGEIVLSTTGRPFNMRRSGRGGRSSQGFSPDGTRFLSIEDGKTVRLWNAVTGAALLTREFGDPPAYENRGGMITSKGESRLNWRIQFSSDGKRIVCHSRAVIELWNAETGDVIMTKDGGQHGWLHREFSPDLTRALSATRGRAPVSLWNAETGDAIQTTPLWLGHKFSPDGTRIIFHDSKTVTVRDAETGDELLTLRPDLAPVLASSNRVLTAAFSPGGMRIVTRTPGTIELWNTETGEAVMTAWSDRGWQHTSFSPDGTRLLSFGDETVKMWDAETGHELLHVRGHSLGNLTSHKTLKFSTDGTRAVIRENNENLGMWDAETGDRIDHLKVMRCPDVTSRRVTNPDGTRIVAKSYGGLKLWGHRDL